MSCVFCSVDAVIEGELAYVRLDKYPVSPGHCLIVPRRHVDSWFGLTRTEQEEILSLVTKTKAFIEGAYSPDGYNVGFNSGEAAGQTIDHSHLHIIPRYFGDMNDPRGGVRGVIPEKQKYTQGIDDGVTD
jgi:diadenosine tetraphosphate (Ap4A) HIT family hydrolase